MEGNKIEFLTGLLNSATSWLNRNTNYVYIFIAVCFLFLAFALYKYTRKGKRAPRYQSANEIIGELKNNKTNVFPICEKPYLLTKRNVRIPSYREFAETIGNDDFNAEIEDEELGTVMACINFGDNLPTVTVPIFQTNDKGKQVQNGEKTVTLRQRMHNGQSVYWLRCMKKEIAQPHSQAEFLNSFLLPIEPKRELDEILPENLWIALHRAYQLVPIVYEIPPPEWLMSMMKYSIIALVIGAFIFIVAKGK